MEFINKNKNVLITIVIMGLLMAAYIASTNRDVKEEKALTKNAINCAGITSSVFTDYKNSACGQEKAIVYVMRTGCSFCEKVEPIRSEIVDEYDLNMVKIDTADFDEATFNELLNTNEYLKNGDWGTPLFMVVENGKVLDVSVGYKEKAALVDFFEKNGFINE